MSGSGNARRRWRWWSQRTGAQQVTIIGAVIGAFGAILAAVIISLQGAPTISVFAGSSSSSSSGTPASSPTSGAPPSHAISGPPVIVEDVHTGGGYSDSSVAPAMIVLNSSQLTALQAGQWNASLGPLVATNQLWITLTVAGNSDAPVTINNLTVVKTCTDPLTHGATLFYAPPGAGAMGTSPVYFNLDQPDLIGQYLSGTTGLVNGYFFARSVVTLGYREPWTFTIFAETSTHYCSFYFRMSVATPHGPVTEEISNNGKPFLLTSDGEKTGEPPFSSYSVVYALLPGSPGYVREDPAKFQLKKPYPELFDPGTSK